METPRKLITAKLSTRKPGSSSVLIILLSDNKDGSSWKCQKDRLKYSEIESF